MTTVSLVTGASRGLGRNTAISIARRGGDVIFTYRRGDEQAKAVVAAIQAMGRKVVALRLDVTDIGSFGRFADTVRSQLSTTWGRDRFDHLVNNAGQGEMASFAETTEAHSTHFSTPMLKASSSSRRLCCRSLPTEAAS